MIVLAFDVGSKESSYARIEARGGNGLPVTCAWLEGGIVQSHAEAVYPLLEFHEWRPDVVAVETLRGIAYPTKGAGIVPALIASSNVAGGIAWLAWMLTPRPRIIERPAVEWRQIVLGTPRATDAHIKRIVPGLIAGFPSRSNDHLRDAAGLAVSVAWRDMRRAA